jgi:hypothetical protein
LHRKLLYPRRCERTGALERGKFEGWGLLAVLVLA